MSDLAQEYRQQFAWRDWPGVLQALPELAGATVLDLGCGIGDLAAELAARGARVIGFDANAELLAAARARAIPRAEFRAGDLRELPDPGVVADGLWCGFAAAYFPDLAAVLAAWARSLRPGGWIALTEIDDLFGHEPLGEPARALLAAYAAESLAAGRYDFHMGRKLGAHAERAGFRVSVELSLPDPELACAGPARPDVIAAWRARLERMRLLQERCGAGFAALRDEFLACLARPDHCSTAQVRCCIAVRARA